MPTEELFQIHDLAADVQDSQMPKIHLSETTQKELESPELVAMASL
jgi:hypothetical protein